MTSREWNVGLHCLVTGASGYLGRALVTGLAERGHRVTAQRNRSRAIVDAHRWIQCELPDGVHRLPLEDVDVVFHAAGIAHQHAQESRYRAVNIEASRQLAHAAVAAGVRHLVFLSSVKASAACPRQTSLDYAASKALAEQAVEQICAGTGTALSTVRPALIYSADAPGHLHWLRQWAAWRLPAPPAGGTRSMIGREDLVRLLCLLAESTDQSADSRLIVATDGQRYSAARLHRAFASALQRRPLLPSPPAALWRLAARVVDTARGEPAGSTWQRLAGTEEYTATGLEELGFRVSMTFEDSLNVGAPCC